MARRHKKAGAGMAGQTSLTADRITAFCHQATEAAKRMNSKVVIESETPSQVTLVTRNVVGVMQNRFRVNILDRGAVRGVSTELLEYKTQQQRVMLIPIMPKQLVGFGAYRAFADTLASSIRSADSAADVTVRDR